jgi:hypothetical protein
MIDLVRTMRGGNTIQDLSQKIRKTNNYTYQIDFCLTYTRFLWVKPKTMKLVCVASPLST